MRILGVSKKWDKLNNDDFTTFRFARKDKDWGKGEVVQVVFKPRSKGREILGVAKITAKVARKIRDATQGEAPRISNDEAIADGFKDWRDMWEWLLKTYGIRKLLLEPMNKLTVRWVNISTTNV